jgi:diguanylate cyclase (GGDEF)-like protein
VSSDVHDSGPLPARPVNARSWRTRTRLTFISAVALGAAWSAGAFAFVWHWENTLAANDLAAVAKSHKAVIQDGLDEYLAKLAALQAFVESNNNLSRREFTVFTGRLLQRESAVQNFSWVPHVTRAARPAFEAAARLDGLANFAVKQVGADDKVGPAGDREEYLPIYYSSVKDRTSPVYGIDLYSQPTLRERLDHARDKDSLSVVPDFALHSVAGNVHGFLFSLPVYRDSVPHDTIDQRRRNFLGFVHGAFFTAQAFDNIITAGTVPRGLDLYLFPDTTPEARPLYAEASRLRDNRPRVHSLMMSTSLGTVAAERHFIDTVSAGDAHWILVATPFSGGPLAIRHDRAWLVLAASLLIGGIGIFHVFNSSRQAGRLLRAHDRISDLAQTDALTGLINRRAFSDILNAAFAGCRRGAKPFALLYLDLDHFKDVNDTRGHPIGDQLLRQVAERIKGAIRTNDFAARFGGDEFAILQSDATTFAADTLAQHINELLGTPFVIDGGEVQVSASIGIAVYSDDAASPDALMIQADLALYRAKEDGRNCYRFHTDELDQQVHQRVTVAAELRRAIDEGELRLHYQPQVDLGSGRVIGLEALARWQHPKRGAISPTEFIPIAERTGSIGLLGQWAFEEACRQLALWRAMDLDPGTMAVNVSAVQLKTQPNLGRQLAAVLRRWNLPPQAVEIELTESVLMDVTQQHGDVFESLGRIGLRTAIDDFGTGYSSLKYLTHYPVTRLKIAQDLVSGVSFDARSATVVRTAIRLAQELGLECIAEGIETKAQADFIRAAGCDFGQGFYCGAPASAAEITSVLKAQRARKLQWADAPDDGKLIQLKARPPLAKA